MKDFPPFLNHLLKYFHALKLIKKKDLNSMHNIIIGITEVIVPYKAKSLVPFWLGLLVMTFVLSPVEESRS